MINRRGTDLIPPIHDLSDPDKICDALCRIQGDVKVLKIHRAFGQMKLFHQINSENNVRDESHVKILNKRVEKKADQVFESEQKSSIQNYRDEYNGGCKWQAVASWFGDTSIVMLFIVAGESFQHSRPIPIWDFHPRGRARGRQCVPTLENQQAGPGTRGKRIR